MKLPCLGAANPGTMSEKNLPIFDEILCVVGHNFSTTDEYHLEDEFNLP